MSVSKDHFPENDVSRGHFPALEPITTLRAENARLRDQLNRLIDVLDAIRTTNLPLFGQATADDHVRSIQQVCADEIERLR